MFSDFWTRIIPNYLKPKEKRKKALWRIKCRIINTEGRNQRKTEKTQIKKTDEVIELNIQC